MNIKEHLAIAVRMTVVTTVLLGIVYPLLVTGLAQLLFPDQANGQLIVQNDDGGSAYVPADPNTGNHWDTYLQQILQPGSYTVSVMAFSNFANGPNLSGCAICNEAETNGSERYMTEP